ncbi:hypothetical protein E4T50_14182 [Aureobasidium sp. EXF-12298]|nr:hypothetical protein E4T50_14182 [Aureobasidium sp. EXF-12298]
MPDTNVNPRDFVLDNRRRLASPNERRCITRQDIGHQRKLIVGAVYTSNTHDDIIALKHGKQPFFQALRFCIETHPLLSTVILNADTEVPEFATPKALDLDKHLEIVVAEHLAEEQYIENLLARIGDEKFESLKTIPPWKVVLAALPRCEGSGKSRLLVLFTNYHSHGDGRSGLAFQDSFHKGLSEYISQTHKDESDLEDTICQPPTTPLLPPIEDDGRMTLSWSYLLSPLLGTYLPRSIVSYLGLRDSWLSSEADFWRGEKTSFDPENHCTGLVLLTLDCSTKEKILQTCRNNHTIFTGLLQHLVARSLNAPDGGALSTSTFLAGVAIDMRHLFPGTYSRASMMNCVTGHSELINSTHLQEEQDWATNPSSPFWQAAQKTSESLKVAASTLHNQPIGLLQYLKAFRPWTVGRVGKERDMSFEISNLGAFKPTQESSLLAMEKCVFSQPAKASGSLLDSNAVSNQGGPLVLTITWQKGVLGVGDGREERAFVERVCGKLEVFLTEIADGGLQSG